MFRSGAARQAGLVRCPHTAGGLAARVGRRALWLGAGALALLAAAALVLAPAPARAADGVWTPINAGLTDLDVKVLTIAPSDHNRLYAGSTSFDESGKVFRSSDGGATWTAGQSFTFINALVVDPTSATTVYIAHRNGVSKSTDGGATFNPVNNGLVVPVDPDPAGASIIALAIAPSAPQTLFAAEINGEIFTSTNGGGSWALTTSNAWASLPGGTSRIPRTLAISPTAPGTVYLGGDLLNGVKTTNGGASWAAMAIPKQNQDHIVVAPSAPQTLYADTFVGPDLFKSTDGGASWAPTAQPFSSETWGEVSSIAVHPQDPQTVYVGGGGANAEYLRVSTDGGASWRQAAAGLTSTPSQVVIDPAAPGTVFVATRGGGVFTASALTVPPPPPADSDSDGVADAADRCPAQAGPAGNGGCPVVAPVPADTDQDGVPDARDRCPTVKAATASGCPARATAKLTAVTSLPLAVQARIRATGPGKLTAQLLRGKKLVRSKVVTVTKAAGATLTVRLAGTAGRYTLRLTFRPRTGVQTMVSKAVRIR